MRVATLISWIVFTSVLGCGDPLRDRRVELLGEEDANFPADARHRPGQPCTWCHNAYEGAKPEMTIGGTTFFQPADPEEPPFIAGNFVVRLLDSDGKTINLQANACGNYWATPEQFDPVFPMRTRILADVDGDLVVNVGMSTRIGREGSCGACHTQQKTPFSPGPIIVNAPDPANPPFPPAPTDCPPPRFAPDMNARDFTFD